MAFGLAAINVIWVCVVFLGHMRPFLNYKYIPITDLQHPPAEAVSSVTPVTFSMLHATTWLILYIHFYLHSWWLSMLRWSWCIGTSIQLCFTCSQVVCFILASGGLRGKCGYVAMWSANTIGESLADKCVREIVVQQEVWSSTTRNIKKGSRETFPVLHGYIKRGNNAWFQSFCFISLTRIPYLDIYTHHIHWWRPLL